MLLASSSRRRLTLRINCGGRQVTVVPQKVRAFASSDWSTGPLHDRYLSIVQESVDPVQLQTLRSLERLRHDLGTHAPPPSVTSSVPAIDTSSTSFILTGWFGSHSWIESPTGPTTKPAEPAIRGVYLHGGVGCGKTFLMNKIFHDSLADTAWSKERQKTHFHKFMLRVHQEMHMARKHRAAAGGAAASDAIIPAVVDTVAAAGRLLCFDEFQVTDVADALILQRLFTGLWEKGCVVVATSNRPPDDLYLNGLQRDRFVPFIEQLKANCEEVSMWESDKDYRLTMKRMDENKSGDEGSTNDPTARRSKKLRQVYFEGGKEALKDFDELFYEMAGVTAVTPTSLRTQGRNVAIPQASLSKGVCRFTFEDLCKKALGAADYLVLGQHFHTVFVDKIPVLKLEHVNWVRRFIVFVDCMYESNCKLVLHAKTAPADIFQPGADAGAHDEVFAFQRTVSRLREMSSQIYLQKQQKLAVHPSAESKASLLSHRKASVNVIPSLGDAR